MFKLVYSIKEAHEDGILVCDWREKRTIEMSSVDDITDKSDGDLVERIYDCIVTSSLDEKVKIWNYDPRYPVVEHLHTTSGPSNEVLSVVINQDATLVASSSLDKTIDIWSTSTGLKEKTISTDTIEMWKIAFSPDNRYIVAGSVNGHAIAYGVESGIPERLFDTEGIFSMSIAYSPDGRYIASGSTCGIICIFDVETGQRIHNIKKLGFQVRSLCFSSDSKFVLIGSYNMLTIHKVCDGKYVTCFGGHASAILGIDYGPDGRTVASCSADNTIKIWDIRALSCIHTIREHTDDVRSIKYNSIGDKMISVSEDKKLNIYSKI